ncbi:MBL fold metallo-hydrolase [Patescibacteria group bacterium]|nr:MBL fold metallo-hydrolase [Patescibacteria group bacterium]
MTYYIQQFRSPRGCLSYIVSDTERKEALIIDPSVEVNTEEYINYLKDNELILRFIIETHTHADHISSAQKVKAETEAKILQHKNSASSLKDRALNEETLMLGDTEVQFLYTPGHTDDCICIRIGNAVFTGDTLLIGGTGRTDFQNGSSQDLYNSIWKKLMVLSDSTKVYPAHNYKNQINSTIGYERAHNPRLALSHDEFVTTMDAHHPQKPDLFDTAVAENSK